MRITMGCSSCDGHMRMLFLRHGVVGCCGLDVLDFELCTTTSVFVAGKVFDFLSLVFLKLFCFLVPAWGVFGHFLLEAV